MVAEVHEIYRPGTANNQQLFHNSDMGNVQEWNLYIYQLEGWSCIALEVLSRPKTEGTSNAHVVSFALGEGFGSVCSRSARIDLKTSSVDPPSYHVVG